MTVYISPYRQMANFRNVMNRLIEENLDEAPLPEREMVLALDVQATEEEYEITALVPGLEPDDLGIEILNNTVSRAESLNPAARKKPNTCCVNCPLESSVG